MRSLPMARETSSPAEDRHHDAPSVRRRAMLPNVERLPGAERELVIRDRDRLAGLGDRGADVARHVVGALGVVLVTIALRCDALDPFLKVAEHRGIGVLLDDEARGGVLDE